jgi:hypothetical protein
MAKDALAEHDFPPDLEVREQAYATTGTELVFKWPAAVPADLGQLFKLNSDSSSILMVVTKGDSIHIRCSDAQARLDFLLFVLSRLKRPDGRPVYGKELPIFPLWRWQSLSPKVRNDATIEDLRAIPELQYDKWTKPFDSGNAADVCRFVGSPLELSAALAALLVAYFAPNQIAEFYRSQDKPKVIKMEIPLKLPVCFRMTPSGTYVLTFLDHGPHSAADIRGQIERLAVPTLLGQDCFVATIRDSDELQDEYIEELVSPFYAVAVRLPIEDPRLVEPEDGDDDEIDDPSPDDQPLAGGRFLVTKYRFSEGDERGLEEAFRSYFEDVRLVLCRKCKMLFSAARERDAVCYTYEHTGHRIPFQGGDMEEVEYCEPGQEPYQSIFPGGDYVITIRKVWVEM